MSDGDGPPGRLQIGRTVRAVYNQFIDRNITCKKIDHLQTPRIIVLCTLCAILGCSYCNRVTVISSTLLPTSGDLEDWRLERTGFAAGPESKEFQDNGPRQRVVIKDPH